MYHRINFFLCFFFYLSSHALRIVKNDVLINKFLTNRQCRVPCNEPYNNILILKIPKTHGIHFLSKKKTWVINIDVVGILTSLEAISFLWSSIDKSARIIVQMANREPSIIRYRRKKSRYCSDWKRLKGISINRFVCLRCTRERGERKNETRIVALVTLSLKDSKTKFFWHYLYFLHLYIHKRMLSSHRGGRRSLPSTYYNSIRQFASTFSYSFIIAGFGY
jgi:hypothetical protein